MNPVVTGTDSILLSIKELLGINSDDIAFDTEIAAHINSTFIELQQMGIGPENGFIISSETETWNQFTNDTLILSAIRTYIYLKVKLVFDPPASASAIESFKNLIDRFEWRLTLSAEMKNQRKETNQNG